MPTGTPIHSIKPHVRCHFGSSVRAALCFLNCEAAGSTHSAAHPGLLAMATEGSAAAAGTAKGGMETFHRAAGLLGAAAAEPAEGDTESRAAGLLGSVPLGDLETIPVGAEFPQAPATAQAAQGESRTFLPAGETVGRSPINELREVWTVSDCLCWAGFIIGDTSSREFIDSAPGAYLAELGISPGEPARSLAFVEPDAHAEKLGTGPPTGPR